MVEYSRLVDALDRSRACLLAERTTRGHWVGELSSSALSTATAISALALVERNRGNAGRRAPEIARPSGAHPLDSEHFLSQHISELIVRGLRWLAAAQNEDGGWGDTDKSRSNIATTLLVRAAFRLTGVPAGHADLMERSAEYVERQGGIPALWRRYGKDKTFAVPILTNCALAGLVPWSDVPALPFELACLPQWTYRLLRLPVVSYAIPAMVAIGQARYFHHKPLNPVTRLIRKSAAAKSLDVLAGMQPASGGFLEATPLTSFVAMSLASIGQAAHPVTQRAVKFLLASARPDGSWPIDTNLATWNTTLSMNALAAGGEDVSKLGCLQWLLACQHREQHAYTGAAPGGWGWSDLSGAVPDADDTAGALLALDHLLARGSAEDRDEIMVAASAGVEWLLELQNKDGGWPTFCRGWGVLPFDRSGTDLTAHALRALAAWHSVLSAHCLTDTNGQQPLGIRMQASIERGFEYLTRRQQADGSWMPLWFGNQDHPADANPVYGTAKVLLAYRDLDRGHAEEARRGAAWLVAHQNADGGWNAATHSIRGEGKKTASLKDPPRSTVEETALAVEALLGEPEHSAAVDAGLDWLVEAVERGRQYDCSPIGLYFAKLWYYEKLYPLIFTVSALGQAVERRDREQDLPLTMVAATRP